MKIARAALHHKQRRSFLSSLLACSGIAAQAISYRRYREWTSDSQASE